MWINCDFFISAPIFSYVLITVLSVVIDQLLLPLHVTLPWPQLRLVSQYLGEKQVRFFYLWVKQTSSAEVIENLCSLW